MNKVALKLLEFGDINYKQVNKNKKSALFLAC
jgi:hypothetical protein